MKVDDAKNHNQKVDEEKVRDNWKIYTFHRFIFIHFLYFYNYNYLAYYQLFTKHRISHSSTFGAHNIVLSPFILYFCNEICINAIEHIRYKTNN